jgi:hypothetical protein
MKRGVGDLTLDEAKAHQGRRKQDPQMDAEDLTDPAQGDMVAQEENHSGYVNIFSIGNPTQEANPYTRLLHSSIQKEANRRGQSRGQEAASLQALLEERISSRAAKEEDIQAAYTQLAGLRRYVDGLAKLHKDTREELIVRLKHKQKIKEELFSQQAGLRDQKKKVLSEETQTLAKDKKNELEAKQLLSEIIRLKQSLEDADKRIEKLHLDREERKVKMNQDELVVKKAHEKDEIQKTLNSLVQRVAERNKLFSKEYLSVRVLNEQVSRIKHHSRVLAVLVPKENVPNPFQLQPYLKVSKHHRSLSVINNEKIQHPEKYALSDLDERVGNVEEYGQKVDCLGLLKNLIEKSASKQQASHVKKQVPKKDLMDFNDIVSLENSEEEEEDAPEIIQTTIEIQEGSNFKGGFRGILPEGKKLSENAKNLAKFLAPDPVKVFNDALVLKKSARRMPQSASNTVCKFDMIITNDYVSTFFDNNVILKLYFELELFIKSLLYKNFDKVLAKISFYSEEYKKILNTERQRDNFNLHYHTEESLPDVNVLLHAKAKGSQPEAKVIARESFALNEEDVRRAKFLNLVLPQGRPDSTPTEQRNEKSSVGWSDQNLIVLMGVKNRGLLPGLLRLINEELAGFDNYAASVTKTQFIVEIHSPDAPVGNIP